MAHARVVIALALVGCGGASARLQMSNDTPLARSQDALPDGRALELKIIAAYLAADVDPVTMNNVGDTQMIWLNPQCNGEIDGCNIDGFTMPAGPRITSYFDLARTTDEVNADLNSEDMTIASGSYKYARIELCKAYGDANVPTVPALKWAGPGMTAEQPLFSGDCGRTSLAFDPPLVLGDGDSVSISLGYNLDAALVSGAPMAGTQYSLDGDMDADGRPHFYRACVDVSDDVRDCMDFPDFAPTATKL
jgi:hypothetical protein